jgi:predicted dehydrogenase
LPKKKVRMGIAGVGAMGQGHVGAFMANPDSEVVAICDQSKEWVEHCKNQWGTKYAFTDWHDLAACDEVDAVAVCFPTIFHDPVTIAALDAGKHVLCEKPMAMSTKKAQAMADAASRNNKILMVSYNQRFGNDIQFLKKYIEEGNMGEVYFVRTAWRRAMGVLPADKNQRATGEQYSRNWFNEKKMGGGAALDLGSHVVDLAMYLMGFPKIKQVVGMAYTKFLPEFLAGKDVGSDADDHSVGFAKFENGASMQIEASYGSYVEHEKIIQAIYGDKGGACRESGQPIKLFVKSDGEYKTIIPTIDMPSTRPMDHFIECILENKTPIVTPEQGVAVTQILEGIYKSSARK